MQNATIPKSQWLLFTSLYTTQYIGIGFMMVAMMGILRSRGADLADLSMVYFIGVPWILKFLWAPLIDRFSYKKWGHYRSWLLILQLLMVATLLLISQLSLDNDLKLIMLLGIVFATFSASQDIAVDALASIEFNHHQRGMVNGIQMAGGLFGNLIGGGVVLMLYPRIGWQGVFLLMAAITSVSWLQLLLFRESARHGDEKILSLGQTFKHFFVFWRGRGLWLLLLPVSAVGYSLVYAILTPLLIDAGKTLADVGMIMNIFGMLTGVASGLAAGWLIQHLGRQRSMWFFYAFQIAAFVAVLPVANNNNDVMLYFVCIVYFITYPLVAAILSTLMMDYAAQDETPGTDYTIQYTLLFFTGILMGGVAMQIAQHFGYIGVLIIAVGVAVVAFLLALLYSQNYLNTSPKITESTPGDNDEKHPSKLS